MTVGGVPTGEPLIESMWNRVDSLIAENIDLRRDNARLRRCARGVHDFEGCSECPGCGFSGIMQFADPIENWPELRPGDGSQFVENESWRPPRWLKAWWRR